MKFNIVQPFSSLNAAFLKVKPIRISFKEFKNNLKRMLAGIKSHETEEFHKNLIAKFLNDTYLKDNFYINTNERTDLVIHTESNALSNVAVLIETKRPTNTSEMLSTNNINVKAFHELVLYYMRERIIKKNIEIKNLIVTNIYEWFIFDANIFEKHFVQNHNFVKSFQDFEAGSLVNKTTTIFYNEIAKPYIETIEEITATYFDLRDYQTALETEVNLNKLSQNLQLNFVEEKELKEEKKLIALYKIFSPEHLLKLPFLNDSNTLDRQFYIELLHIIGLTEVVEDGNKFIKRKPINERDPGSILENTISTLNTSDKLSNLPNIREYGKTKEEQLYGVALELSLTWVNRIIFLKLLESQLLSYHKGNSKHSFLNIKTIPNFDALNNLFFEVLAKKTNEREGENRNFPEIPYLNSSLFELTPNEIKTIIISNLNSNREINIFPQTVLKTRTGKQIQGKKQTLDYFFSFLNSYDFSSEGSLEIQEANKTLINASVLGLIFEKINGYQDGSFFTPGYITMYMCRETIRRAVLRKFNEIKGWQCKDFKGLYNNIKDIEEANQIVNSLKVCDPAVGSGHFLVSALNEIIAVKSDLGILKDRNGLLLRGYEIKIVNDELIVKFEQELFEYQPKNIESQRLQETLFHEKQTIIENCLFGVDINPNSVKICRLRLWIELLKNAYYKWDSNLCELETLPNIDINIKTGNSLISRFNLKADLSHTLRKSKWNIESYRTAVEAYKNSDNREEKKTFISLVDEIRTTFSTDINIQDPRKLKLEKLEIEYYELFKRVPLVETEFTELQEKQLNAKKKKLYSEIEKLKAELEDLKTNYIYDNAFEWRFEFPEVLNNNGDFLGFDVIIGNPPYIQMQKLGGKLANDYKNLRYETYSRTGDIYTLFFERGMELLCSNGLLCLITSNKWMRAGYGDKAREFLSNQTNPLELIDFAGHKVFDSATVDTNILLLEKNINQFKTIACTIGKDFVNENLLADYVKNNFNLLKFENQQSWIIITPQVNKIRDKVEKIGVPLKKWNIKLYRGILTGFNEAFIINGEKKNELIQKDAKYKEIFRAILRGRDIKRYHAEFADLWLINTHNGYKDSNGKLVKRVDVNNYPAIKEHLDFYWNKLLSRTDQGSTPYNLRSCAYLEEFDKEKIVYTKASKEKAFSYLKNHGQYLLQTAYIITGENLKFLTGVLNSKLFTFIFTRFYQGGGIEGEITVQAMQKIPIPTVEHFNISRFVFLVDLILDGKSQGLDTSRFEFHIDLLVYKLYDLSYDEVKVIDNDFDNLLTLFKLTSKNYENYNFDDLAMID